MTSVCKMIVPVIAVLFLSEAAQIGSAKAQAAQPTTPIYAPAVRDGAYPPGLSGYRSLAPNRRLALFTDCAVADRNARAILATPLASSEERRAVERLLHNNLRCGQLATGLSIPLIRDVLERKMVR